MRHIIAGLSKSCGCYRDEMMGKRATTHGCARKNKKLRVYNSWMAMKRRCNTPGYNCYRLYGGRGITYDPRWEKFENFLADMGEPPTGTSLDRINNNGNYCKENCRWSTAKEQSANTRSVKRFMFNGEEVTIRMLCDKYGLKYTSLYGKIWRGVDIHDAVLSLRNKIDTTGVITR